MKVLWFDNSGMDYHEAGIVTLFSWMLGNKLFWQMVVVGTEEKIFLHRVLGDEENDGLDIADNAQSQSMH